MKKIASLSLIFLLSFVFVQPLFADVYPFEEEYSEETSHSLFNDDVLVKETTVVEFEQEKTTKPVARSRSARSAEYGKYSQITWRNFGAVFLNLALGIGGVYKDLFTEALPEYGADLVRLPSVSAEVIGKFAEIERQELFERDAKEKDIQAYIASQEAPLSPKEQELLKELRNKPITSTK